MKSNRKNIILIVILFLIASSCKYDNFYNTERKLQSDKNAYKIGENFELSLTISSDKEKVIYVYKNFKNLSLSVSLINRPKNIQNENWSKWSDRCLNDTTIMRYKISKEIPFQKKFKGQIEQIMDSVFISIPELRFKAAFNKKEFDDSTYVRIHGICIAINPEPLASGEEYFNIKDIRIIE